jgi:hypothetical protein
VVLNSVHPEQMLKEAEVVPVHLEEVVRQSNELVVPILFPLRGAEVVADQETMVDQEESQQEGQVAQVPVEEHRVREV